MILHQDCLNFISPAGDTVTNLIEGTCNATYEKVYACGKACNTINYKPIKGDKHEKNIANSA
jgi:hypothetical protein